MTYLDVVFGSDMMILTLDLLVSVFPEASGKSQVRLKSAPPSDLASAFALPPSHRRAHVVGNDMVPGTT